MNCTAEGEARALLAAAGYDADDAPGALAIARRLGVEVVYGDASMLGGALSSLERVGCRHVIFLRRHLPPARAHWCIAHELAELRLLELGCCDEDVERRADAIAAGLVMPWRAFRVAVEELGHAPAALAREFLVDQTAATLRLAEVCAVERAVVVTPERVYARGEEWVLPCEAEIRRGRLEGMPGIRKVEITDDRRRRAWVA